MGDRAGRHRGPVRRRRHAAALAGRVPVRLSRPARDRSRPRGRRPTAFRAPSPAHEAWARDGAYLVFRQLRQDVAAFWAYCGDQAKALAAGPLPGATPEMVGALIVGRWRDGSPIRLDDPDGGRSRPTRNDFDLSDDPFGFGCPLGAHTRKVNPRSGAIADTSPLDKRLLRRGIPYGEALPGIVRRDDPERGLLFLAYMTSITDQFEFLVSRWINDPHAPSGSGSGQDVLIGQPAAGRTMSVRLPGGETWPFLPPVAFVEATAGQYLFAPSIPALAASGRVMPSRDLRALLTSPLGGAFSAVVSRSFVAGVDESRSARLVSPPARPPRRPRICPRRRGSPGSPRTRRCGARSRPRSQTPGLVVELGLDVVRHLVRGDHARPARPRPVVGRLGDVHDPDAGPVGLDHPSTHRHDARMEILAGRVGRQDHELLSHRSHPRRQVGAPRRSSRRDSKGRDTEASTPGG